MNVASLQLEGTNEQLAARHEGLMAPASAQEIQDAVRTFLDGGSAQQIWDLARTNNDNRKPLVASAGVIPRLVDVLLRDQPHGEGFYVLLALYCLAQIGKVAQDAIGQAHNGAIFKWLAGPQDHGYDDYKRMLITMLTANHSTNTLLLDAARAGVASILDLILHHLRNGHYETAAHAMNVLVDNTRKGDAASTIPDNNVAALATVLDWDPTDTDIQLPTIRYEAAFLLTLAQQCDVKEAQPALSRTPMGVEFHLEVLKSEQRDAQSKLIAVLFLHKLVKENESAALEILSSDGFSGLLHNLRHDDKSEVAVIDVREQTVHLLESMAQLSYDIRDALIKTSVVASLIHPNWSVSEKAAGLNLLRVFLRSEIHASAIARARGMPFLIQLCLHDKQHTSKQDTPIVKILTTLLLGHDDETNNANQRAFVDIDGSIDFLVGVFKTNRDEEVVEFTGKLSVLVPLLIDRLHDRKAKKIDTEGVVLEALEILSRSRSNQSVLPQPTKRVKQLVSLLKTSGDCGIKTQITRILANICYQSDMMSMLTVEQGGAEELVAMVKSTDAKLQTSALMALRNLASNSVNRAKIGSLGIIPRVIEILVEGKSLKQQSAAAALLGNLAFVRASREQVVIHGGVGALVVCMREAPTPQQVEIAAAALWVVVDDQTLSRVVDIGAMAVIKKAVADHPQHELVWTDRLRKRLRAVITC